jgi:hypothetical protein
MRWPWLQWTTLLLLLILRLHLLLIMWLHLLLLLLLHLPLYLLYWRLNLTTKHPVEGEEVNGEVCGPNDTGQVVVHGK